LEKLVGKIEKLGSFTYVGEYEVENFHFKVESINRNWYVPSAIQLHLEIFEVGLKVVPTLNRTFKDDTFQFLDISK